MGFREICRKFEALEIQGPSDVAERAMKTLVLRLKGKEPKDACLKLDRLNL